MLRLTITIQDESVHPPRRSWAWYGVFKPTVLLYQQSTATNFIIDRPIWQMDRAFQLFLTDLVLQRFAVSQKAEQGPPKDPDEWISVYGLHVLCLHRLQRYAVELPERGRHPHEATVSRSICLLDSREYFDESYHGLSVTSDSNASW